jgi:hypothetical protein
VLHGNGQSWNDAADGKGQNAQGWTDAVDQSWESSNHDQG